MERAEGEHVAFLTQDSIPADECWLARMIRGFELTEDVGSCSGPTSRARTPARSSPGS